MNVLQIPKQRERVTDADWRFANANIALSCFTKDTTIQPTKSGHVLVMWGPMDNLTIKRWQVRHGQDFYPVWSHKWAHGGTKTTALSQLIRWCRGRPVLPLSTWRYWAGETCRIAGDEGERLIDRLVYAQYPDVAHCVLCGVQLGGLDWWSLNGVSGPCCPMNAGCQASSVI
jgi:hypothetical protein